MGAQSNSHAAPNIVRSERDSFGEVRLDSSCFYGIQTVRCLENLSFSPARLRDYPRLIESLAKVKRACALANAEAGVLSTAIAQAIEAACLELEAGEHREQFLVDMLHGGGGIAFNFNLNEVVANLANLRFGSGVGTYDPVHPKIHVNASQSTADVCHTAFRLAVYNSLQALLAVLAQLYSAFIEKQQAFKEVETLARTCLQDAMTVPLGTIFGAYAAVTKRRSVELSQCTERLRRVNLGGTVIGSGDGAGTPYRQVVIRILSQVTAQELSLRDDLYDAAQNIDDLLAVSAHLRILAQCLIKIAKDLRLLSSGPEAGFGELILPALQQGSSFFTTKINPVVPETLIQACMQVVGCDRAAQSTLEHAELNLNVFEGAAVKNVLDAAEMLQRAVQLFIDKCVIGITADAERCAQHAGRARHFINSENLAAASEHTCATPVGTEHEAD